MNRIKIVVVEDEPDIVEVISYNLKREGYKVMSANRGDERINLIRNKSPSLGHTGLDVARNGRPFGLSAIKI